MSGASASLSMSHNSNGEAVRVDQPDLPFRLTGSQQKTAYALERNVARMIEEAGIERVGFLTLTVGDDEPGGFRQVWDAVEASRRINSLGKLLRELFPRMVVVTERHKSGAIHFHLIVETMGDIRTGFDFEAFLRARKARKDGGCDAEAEKRYVDSAPPALRALWGMLRERLPGFGFGRAELTPIYKTGEAISRYVSKYVEKNLFNRLVEDRRKKLVRYWGWNKSQMKPNEFSWATPRAAAWRRNAEKLSGLVGVRHRGEVADAFGPRWAYRLSRVMNAVAGDDRTVCGEVTRTLPVREAARALVLREAIGTWVSRRRRADGRQPGLWRWQYRTPGERRKQDFEAVAEWNTKRPPMMAGT